MPPPEAARESLSAIVLEGRLSDARGVRRAPRGATFAEGSVGALVLGRRPPRPLVPLGVGCAAAAILHVGAGLSTVASAEPTTGPAPESTAPSPMVVSRVVELPPPPRPPPESAPPPPPTPPRSPAPASAPTSPPSEPAAAPAAAAEVLAADPAPDAPVDFTDFAMVTGDALAYAGSVTASAGTATSAATENVHPWGRPGGRGSGSGPRARAVGAPESNWRCPWPEAASALAIHVQTVVLRAEVGADGRVLSTEVLTDPGHGFGPLAAECARRQRFTPARDDEGRPIAATSPPIRVRFTR